MSVEEGKNLYILLTLGGLSVGYRWAIGDRLVHREAGFKLLFNHIFKERGNNAERQSSTCAGAHDSAYG
jgi:hypothetical protein